jgi:PiT family inorganic phosphate transporter
MTGPATPPVNQWKTLDKDLARFSQLYAATAATGRPVVAAGIAFVFVLICAVAAYLLKQGQP